MPLSDREIRAALAAGEINITPLSEESIQASSYDLHLAPTANVLRGSEVIDLASDIDVTDRYDPVDLRTGYTIPPGGMILGSAAERIEFGPYCGIVLNRSSFARIGVHFALSGYANPGYGGHLPLVVVNYSGVPVRIMSGRRAAQVLFLRVGEVDVGYRARGGKYQGETGPTPSKHHLDKDLVDALKSMGLGGNRLQRVAEVVEKRIDEAAARKASTARKGE